MKNITIFFAFVLLLSSLVFGHEGHDHGHEHEHEHEHEHGHEDHAHAHGHDDVQEEVESDAPSKVVALDPETFDSHIAKNEVSLIEFYAPWCGHCKALAPEYDAASILLDGVASLGKVDCTVHRDLCSRYDVQGFPTVKLFRNDGSEPLDYDQARKADAIVKFVTKQKAPAYIEVNEKDGLNKLIESSEFFVVGFLAADDKTNTEQFVTLAKAYRTDYDFAIVTDNALALQYVPSVPGVAVFRKFDDPKVVFTGTTYTAEALEEFLVESAFPILGTIGPENYQKYVERGFPLYWIFVDFSKDQEVLNVAKEVAKNFRTISFVQLDGIRWADHAKSFGLNGETPGLVLEDRNNRKNYVYPQNQPVTFEALKAQVQGFLDGSLAPTIKSEPIPESNDGPVKIVVGKTYESIVLDSTKDVFLEIYAPWCGHCKALAPKYEKLGESFKDTPSVVIAKIDGTENDIPFEIRGFPTLVFFPANKKDSPIPFDGDRTEAAMAKFIRENASTLSSGQASSTQSSEADSSSHPKDEL